MDNNSTLSYILNTRFVFGWYDIVSLQRPNYHSANFQTTGISDNINDTAIGLSTITFLAV